MLELGCDFLVVPRLCGSVGRERFVVVHTNFSAGFYRFFILFLGNPVTSLFVIIVDITHICKYLKYK